MTEGENRHERIDSFNEELENLIDVADVARLSRSAKQNVQIPKAPTANTKSRFKTIFVSFCVILVIILLVWLLLPRRPHRSPYLPIPYIFSLPFLKTLMKYASLPSHNQVLVISGAHGIGKTRGLLEIEKKLNSSGFLPLHFDFLQITEFSTSADVKQFLLESVYKSLSYIDSIPVNVTQVRKYAPFLDSVIITDSFSLKEPYLHKILSFLNQSLKNGNLAEYDQFFSALDLFSNFLHIVIIANEPFRFRPFITFCKGYSSNTLNIGTIFDINDIYSTDVLENPSIYKIFYVDEFDEQIAKNVLVDVEFVFSKKQFPTLWAIFGGKGYYWSTFHDLIREGYSQNDAIYVIQNRISAKFVRVTAITNSTATNNNSSYNNANEGNYRKMIANRVAFLKKIVRKGKVSLSPDDVQVLAHYCKWGLLAPTGSYEITLTDKMLIAAIKKALKSL